eukprot:gene9057-12217_t
MRKLLLYYQYYICFFICTILTLAKRTENDCSGLDVSFQCNNAVNIIESHSKGGKYSGGVICALFCPGKALKHHYPYLQPLSHDLYHQDQLNLYRLIVAHENLKNGGIVISFFGDDAVLPHEIRKALAESGIVFLSHAYDKSYGLEYVTFVPDHLFVRYEGYKNTIAKVNSPPFNKSFNERLQNIYWRGSATGINFGETYNQRYYLCKLSKSYSWMNTKITKAFTVASDRLYDQEEISAPVSRETDWVASRGVIDIDGSVNAWGLIWRLASGSVIFKFESNWTNSYINNMVPWVHYVPLKADLSDFGEVTRLILDENSIELLHQVSINAKKLASQFTLQAEVVRVAIELNEKIRSELPYSNDTLDYNNNITNNCYHPTDSSIIINDIPILPTLISPFDKTILQFNGELLKYYSSQNKEYFSNILIKYQILQNNNNNNNKNNNNINNNNNNNNNNNEKLINYDCPISNNYILTMAEGYGCAKVALFLRSFRDTGSCANIVIFTSNDFENNPCKNIYLSCGNIIYQKYIKNDKIHLEIRRYILFVQYLKKLKETYSLKCSNVLICDFNDVFFQRDPFQFISKINSEVLLTDEGYNEKNLQITFHDEPTSSNKQWIYEISGQLFASDMTSRIWNMPVLNSGVILGTFNGVFKLLWTMSALANLMDLSGTNDLTRASGVGGTSGQGILNFCYYTGLFNGIVKVKILPPAASPFINGCYYHPQLQDPKKPFHHIENPIVNLLGDPYAIVYMYNRFHMMTIVEEWVLSYGKMDWRFKQVGTPEMCNMTKTGHEG